MPAVSEGVLPNFLVIGAQRCATSWLYFCLKQHSEVYVPRAKELDYFSAHYDKGIEWYREHFRPHAGQKAVGELTPMYLYRRGTAERIAKDLPGVRLVVTLRNPIERAFSQYRKHWRSGLVAADFETALKNNKEYIERGFYHSQLARYAGLFPKEDILVLIYEDIARDHTAYLKKVFSFIGAQETRVPSLAKRRIASEELDGWVHRLFHSSREDSVLSMRPETRAELREIFKAENERLAAFLNRDLGFWV